MATIKVCWEGSGKPVRGSHVSIGFDHGGVSSKKSTDDSGKVYFDTENRSGEVYVDGTTKYNGSLSGDIVVYIKN